MWNVIFYPKAGMRNSPYDYLASMKESERSKMVNRIRVLRELPLNDWPNRWVHQIEGKIYQLSAGDHRLMYFIEGDSIVFVHGFRKKTRRTPKKDKDKAIKHFNEYNSQGGD